MPTNDRPFSRRTSGVLMHITSLPGRNGSGDLSDEALEFVDKLAAAGQSWWQILPVSPPGDAPSCSPYSSPSIFGGSPYLVSPQVMVADGLLDKKDLRQLPRFGDGPVDYEAVNPVRESLLQLAFSKFGQAGKRWQNLFDAFCESESSWLDDEALFYALKSHHEGKPWDQWPKPLRDRVPAALNEVRKALREEIRYHQFVQFMFDRQWRRLRTHARARGIGIIGDMPIFTNHDSIPVWCRPDLWRLDASKKPTVVSGAPPDFFSKDGQRWGHPIYNWPAHAKEDFAWWSQRFEAMFRRVDALRIDHFLGFGRLWTIPSSSPTAVDGKWTNSPGEDLFAAVQKKLGPLPMIAEDLGAVTQRAMVLRDEFSLPGMRVLHFGVPPGDGYHVAHSYPPSSVAYTGTHDNDTSVGFLKKLPAADRRWLIDYMATPGEGAWPMIQTVLRSGARTAIIPMQDLLGLGSEARMNTPGTDRGNWKWRMTPKAFSSGIINRLRKLTDLYGRLPEETPAKKS